MERYNRTKNRLIIYSSCSLSLNWNIAFESDSTSKINELQGFKIFGEHDILRF